MAASVLRGNCRWGLVGLLVALALWQTSASVLAQQEMFIPMLQIVGRDVSGSGDDLAKCGLNEFEEGLAEQMASASEQRRAEMICDPILTEVAQARARDMATRNYFDHTNPDGEGPNYLVRQAGYPLPDWYNDARDGNNIESIGAGYRTPGELWQGWLDSGGHRTHLLGLRDFYAEQVAYGVGYSYDPDSEYGHYWVVLTAHEKDAASIMQLEPSR